ncbi:Peptidase, M28 family [Nitrospira sp. KM1]|nr:Peptidase, M28 family [Nitrospira sp. KM1]
MASVFTRSGWVTTMRPFRSGRQNYHNVVAVRNPARGRQAQQAAPLLIGAHYDTVTGSPGADDNASGLTVLLEVAHRMAAKELVRPIWLAAFCLEEEGLVGSRAFAAELSRSGQPLHGAIILECVGYASQEAGSQRTPPGVPIAVPTVGNFLALIGNESSRLLLGDVLSCAKQTVPQLPVVPLLVPGRGEALPDVRRSDHAAFWDAGFSAIMLTDTANFRNPHYHTVTDTMDTLDLSFLEHVIDLICACANGPAVAG